jgi:glutamyl-tRNA reductase
MMASPNSLFVVGTDHLLAPGHLREELHVGDDEAWAFLGRHTGEGRLLEESILLSTCARAEIYGVADDPERVHSILTRLLARHRGISRETLSCHTRLYTGPEAAEHLFRTAAGLESAVQGEAQILGQVRSVLGCAAAGGTAGPVLTRLFQAAVEVGRTVRAETSIGRGATSLAGAAINEIREHLGDPARASALVLGAGETGRLIVRLLGSSGVGRIVVANRTLARAEAVAAEVSGEAVELDATLRRLPEVDAVFGAVSVEAPLVHRHHLDELVARGARLPRVMVDLSHPRSFHRNLSGVEGVEVVDLDELHERVRSARDSRAREVPRAEALVSARVERFESWMKGRTAVPVLRAMRESVLALAREEADRLGRGRSREDQEELRRLARSLARTLLHHPTLALRTADPDTPAGRSLLESTTDLFGLSPDTSHNEQATG